jgi:hypothetical protein
MFQCHAVDRDISKTYDIIDLDYRMISEDGMSAGNRDNREKRSNRVGYWMGGILGYWPSITGH